MENQQPRAASGAGGLLGNQPGRQAVIKLLCLHRQRLSDGEENDKKILSPKQSDWGVCAAARNLLQQSPACGDDSKGGSPAYRNGF
jgi:hypothetical protein